MMRGKGAFMADIIAIDKKRKIKDKEQSDLVRMHKIMAVRKVFHCTHCASKCEKCGSQLGIDPVTDQAIQPNKPTPYNFCESCAEEYRDYIARLQSAHNRYLLKIKGIYSAFAGTKTGWVDLT